MARYSRTGISSKNNKNYYNTTAVLKGAEGINDKYIFTREGDRLDNLAFQFYEDESLWWYIGKANGITTLNIPAGTSLRIPIDTEFAKGL